MGQTHIHTLSKFQTPRPRKRPGIRISVVESLILLLRCVSSRGAQARVRALRGEKRDRKRLKCNFSSKETFYSRKNRSEEHGLQEGRPLTKKVKLGSRLDILLRRHCTFSNIAFHRRLRRRATSRGTKRSSLLA